MRHDVLIQTVYYWHADTHRCTTDSGTIEDGGKVGMKCYNSFLRGKLFRSLVGCTRVK
jgi:hypothetical protein